MDQVKKELAKYKKPPPGEPYYVAANTGGGAGANIRRRAAAVHQRYGDRGSGDDDSLEPAGLLLKDYLTEEALAREIEVTVRTLRRWRKERRGPPITHIGRQVRYSLTGLRAWLAANEQQMPRAKRPRAAEATTGRGAT